MREQKQHAQLIKQPEPATLQDNVVKLNDFKLIKSKPINNLPLKQSNPKQLTFETKRLLAIRRKKYVQTQLKQISLNKSKSPVYSLNNKTAAKSITSISLNNKSLVRFKLNTFSNASASARTSKITAARIKTLFDQSKRVISRKSLYKVNNMGNSSSNPKILSSKKFKLVNLNSSSIYKSR